MFGIVKVNDAEVGSIWARENAKQVLAWFESHPEKQSCKVGIGSAAFMVERAHLQKFRDALSGADGINRKESLGLN